MKTIVPALAGLLLTVTFGAQAEGIREGRWTYTMTMEMPNMPAMPKVDASKLPPGMALPQMGAGGMTMNFEQCVTRADLVPRNEQSGEHCKITRMDRRGNTVEWTSVCDSPHGKMNATGTATYSGGTMTSTTHVTGKDRSGAPIEMTQKIDGRYLGPCTP